MFAGQIAFSVVEIPLIAVAHAVLLAAGRAMVGSRNVEFFPMKNRRNFLNEGEICVCDLERGAAVGASFLHQWTVFR